MLMYFSCRGHGLSLSQLLSPKNYQGKGSIKKQHCLNESRRGFYNIELTIPQTLSW